MSRLEWARRVRTRQLTPAKTTLNAIRHSPPRDVSHEQLNQTGYSLTIGAPPPASLDALDAHGNDVAGLGLLGQVDESPVPPLRLSDLGRAQHGQSREHHIHQERRISHLRRT